MDKRSAKSKQKALTSIFKAVRGGDSSPQNQTSTSNSPSKPISANQREPIEKIEEEVKREQEVEEEVKQEQAQNEENDGQKHGKIWFWNVDGIRARMRNGALIKFLEQHNPDVLCLNETKIDENNKEFEKIKQKLTKWFPTEL